MSNSPDTQGGVEFVGSVQKPTEYLIVAHYQGSNNSMPVSGFKTLTLAGPPEFKSGEDLIELSGVVATTLFNELHYKDLETTILNIKKLPIK